jgi:hypothetical protein
MIKVWYLSILMIITFAELWDALLVMIYKIANEKVAINKNERLESPIKQSGHMHPSSFSIHPCKTQQMLN